MNKLLSQFTSGRKEKVFLIEFQLQMQKARWMWASTTETVLQARITDGYSYLLKYLPLRYSMISKGKYYWLCRGRPCSISLARRSRITWLVTRPNTMTPLLWCTVSRFCDILAPNIQPQPGHARHPTHTRQTLMSNILRNTRPGLLRSAKVLKDEEGLTEELSQIRGDWGDDMASCIRFETREGKLEGKLTKFK